MTKVFETRQVDSQSSKFCKQCNTVKPIDDFCFDKRRRDGHSPTCRQCTSQKSKEHYRRNIDRIRKQHEAYGETHKEMRREISKRHRLKNVELSKAMNWAYAKVLKLMAIKKLGSRCKRCGFDDIRVLQIDHVNGGGRAEIKELGGNQRKLLKKIIDSEDVSEYQLLCPNCNWLKYYETDLDKFVKKYSHFIVEQKSKVFIRLVDALDARCTLCHQPCITDDGNEESLKFHAQWGYGSGFDLQEWKLRLCYKCSDLFKKWVEDAGGKIDIYEMDAYGEVLGKAQNG